MRIVIFMLLLGIVLGSITLLGRQDGLSDGNQTSVSYGWPQPWLRADVVGIDITGKHYDQVRTDRIVDWGVFSISAGIAACMALLLSLPLFLFLPPESRKVYAGVLLAVVACLAIVWAAHPVFGLFYSWPPPNGAGWQVWVRMYQPFFLISPSRFANGVHWRLAEAVARLVAVGLFTFGVFGFTRFQQHKRPAA